jgi:prepilin-type N-terminal cleavage/methylation domain-containing protein
MMKTHLSNTRRNKGFTVIELLIATAVFSVVLLVFLSAFLRISELFYKGVNLSNTQETSRNVVQSIADDIQFYHDPPTIGYNYFCIGGHRYTYNKGVQYVPGRTFGIVKENVTSCSPPGGSPSGQELLDPGMQLNNMALSCTGNQCTVAVNIVFYSNDPSVLAPSATDPNAHCTGPDVSTQYCATAVYTRTILQSF